MKYYMKLQLNPFNKIKEGFKTIEMRLYAEKRSIINIGDEIEFTNMEDGETLNVEVVGLHQYKNFEELYRNFPKEQLGYSKEEFANAEDMSKYYSKEDILKYGVLGIEIKLK